MEVHKKYVFQMIFQIWVTVIQKIVFNVNLLIEGILYYVFVVGKEVMTIGKINIYILMLKIMKKIHQVQFVQEINVI